MAKGQKRSSKEPKKQKDAEKKAKKLSGPKYLRQPEIPPTGNSDARKIGRT
jgi:hypothetical protein